MSFDHYLDEMETIEGWLDRPTALISRCIMEYQTTNGIAGNVCEIGVHHGRYFISLGLSLAQAEKAIAIDLFENQDENIDQSGQGDRLIFDTNVRRFLKAEQVHVIRENSLRISSEMITDYGQVRFFSIDGGHTEAVVENDLSLAERVLCDGGVVALDDILHPAWTGVVSGLARYKYLRRGNLKAFALLSNKLMLCRADDVARYRKLMKAEFPAISGRHDLEMMSDLIDQFNTQPDYMLEIAETQRHQIRRLQSERDGIVRSRRYRIASVIADYANRWLLRT
jgi:hypothetical protein